MRRKMRARHRTLGFRRKASMRPARYAPENVDGLGIDGEPDLASMRPARYAPENSQWTVDTSGVLKLLQ